MTRRVVSTIPGEANMDGIQLARDELNADLCPALPAEHGAGWSTMAKNIVGGEMPEDEATFQEQVQAVREESQASVEQNAPALDRADILARWGRLVLWWEQVTRHQAEEYPS